MVRSCVYPGCFRINKVLRLRELTSTGDGRLTFHQFPWKDPERLKLWLLAIRWDVNTPMEKIERSRLCSEHFTSEDYEPEKGKPRRLLKSSAVPIPALLFQPNEETTGDPIVSAQPSLDSPATGKDEEIEVLCTSAYIEDVPPSTPVKHRDIEQCECIEAGLLLTLTSPESVASRTCPSTSGTYIALPPIRSNQSDEPAQTKPQSEENNLDISMLSLDCPSDKKDVSFVPTSSTSTSTAEEEREDEMWKERKWIVNESNVMGLFKRCQECGALITETKKITSGSLIQVQWECERRHQGQWSSCSDVRGMPLNNLLVSASVLFTGATYTDIADWAALLNLQVPKKTTFYTVQSSYLTPVVDAAYREKQTAILDELHIQNALQKRVHISGDGRSDSPGFSAKYNTYSLMDDTSDQIVHFELVQVTEASSSVAMEPIGFKRGLNKILDKGIKVDVVATDRSPSIRKLMRVDYPFIRHEFDIWHVVKGLLKKLLSLSRYMYNRDLQPWIKCICNHLWYSCATCGGDPDDLIRKWKSILRHICGEHIWTQDGIQHRCLHSDLSPDQQRRKRWLKKESRAYHTLETLVLDKGLLKDLCQMSLFKHTGKFEAFHSVLLKYCQKNLHFHYSSMLARTQLAILDHNENVHRKQATTTSGVHRYNVVFPKCSKEWEARKQFEPTTQTFRDDLVRKVLECRNDPNIIYKDQSSHDTIPSLPADIAQKPEPDKEEAISKHQSWFTK
ncbi:uncharacterized protein LOC127648291 [Xyrauchen texanus]|uniref:uncharacterized protein LOC127648291 n=1 Tax=Xyrauchen texanus TaxID=154827 RepID=UPI0022418885|nr:uncharacterized protein LOC127648291 [Xyrauchen texanus]